MRSKIQWDNWLEDDSLQATSAPVMPNEYSYTAPQSQPMAPQPMQQTPAAPQYARPTAPPPGFSAPITAPMPPQGPAPQPMRQVVPPPQQVQQIAPTPAQRPVTPRPVHDMRSHHQPVQQMQRPAAPQPQQVQYAQPAPQTVRPVMPQPMQQAPVRQQVYSQPVAQQAPVQPQQMQQPMRPVAQPQSQQVQSFVAQPQQSVPMQVQQPQPVPVYKAPTVQAQPAQQSQAPRPQPVQRAARPMDPSFVTPAPQPKPVSAPQPQQYATPVPPQLSVPVVAQPWHQPVAAPQPQAPQQSAKSLMDIATADEPKRKTKKKSRSFLKGLAWAGGITSLFALSVALGGLAGHNALHVPLPNVANFIGKSQAQVKGESTTVASAEPALQTGQSSDVTQAASGSQKPDTLTPSSPYYQYTDNFKGAEIIISRQPLPDNFKTDNAALQKLAGNIGASEPIQTSKWGTAYRLSSTSAEVLTFANKDKLVFIRSTVHASADEWKNYIDNTFKLQ